MLSLAGENIRMVQLIGLVALVVVVAGALLVSGGQGVFEALPLELGLIVGAALGTLFIGNSTKVAMQALGGFRVAMTGSKWRTDDYAALLVLLHGLTSRARKRGLIAIEDDIEAPETSAAFAAAPSIRDDEDARTLICDAFRLMALDLSNPARAEERMERMIGVAVERRMRGVHALHTVADALPALGIVAAVLGIIRTMGAINESPTILGAMIATALLGTFLGVFLAYGVVGPVASRFGQVVEEDANLLDVARAVLSAHGAGLSPRTAIEIGRAMIPAEAQPPLETLDHALHAQRFIPRRAA